jgi:hypothetical protein
LGIHLPARRLVTWGPVALRAAAASCAGPPGGAAGREAEVGGGVGALRRGPGGGARRRGGRRRATGRGRGAGPEDGGGLRLSLRAARGGEAVGQLRLEHADPLKHGRDPWALNGLTF